MRLPLHGSAALACWFVHAANHVLRGTPHDLLWACNVAVPMLAIGCFLGRAMPCAIALLWLAFGTPIWLLDLATGAGLIITSPLVHAIAPVIGVLAVRRLGWPHRSWMAASVASFALVIVSRFVGSPGANVNLAFRVHAGWEGIFGSHSSFVGLLLAASALVFFTVERAVRALLRPENGPSS